MPSRRTRKWLIGTSILIGAIAIVIAIPTVISYYRTHITTDDAFVDGPIHYITPQIEGKLTSLLVDDNEQVVGGQVVAELDARELATDLAIAEKNLAAVHNRVAAQMASIAAADADIQSIEAQLVFAEKEKDRVRDLERAAAATPSQYDQAHSRSKSLTAQLAAARRRREALVAGLGPRDSDGKVIEVQLAQAQLDKTKLRLSYATIRATTSGRVTRKRVEQGQVVSAGQPLFALVPLGRVYVTANYKETQIDRIHPGQRVRIAADAYPDANLEGRVDSIMAGTGAVFSLIPPENATGNFVKVVQRVPVKIVFTNLDESLTPLPVGTSVVPTILVEDP